MPIIAYYAYYCSTLIRRFLYSFSFLRWWSFLACLKRNLHSYSTSCSVQSSTCSRTSRMPSKFSNAAFLGVPVQHILVFNFDENKRLNMLIIVCLIFEPPIVDNFLIYEKTNQKNIDRASQRDI